MTALSFEWDPNKAKTNETKHGVSFEEACTVFHDEDALVIPDPEHSLVEKRFVIMGLSAASRVLVIVHCLRRNNRIIRIISARRAGTKEKKPYLEKRS